MEKNEKDRKEIEYLELKKKAKDNKLMTPEEMKKLSSYKTREIVNQVLRVFGLLAATFVFVLTWDIIAEGSLWGLIDGKFNLFWDALIGYNSSGSPGDPSGNLNILWAVFGDVTGIKVFGGIIMSVIHIALCVAFAYLIAYSVKDIITFVKKLVTSPIKIAKEVSGTVKESVNLADRETERKPLFPEEKKTRPGRKKKTVSEKKDSEEVEFSNEELDRLLKGETLEDIRKERDTKTKEKEKVIAEDTISVNDDLEVKEEAIEDSQLEEKKEEPVEKISLEKRRENSEEEDFLKSLKRIKSKQ